MQSPNTDRTKLPQPTVRNRSQVAARKQLPWLATQLTHGTSAIPPTKDNMDGPVKSPQRLPTADGDGLIRNQQDMLQKSTLSKPSSIPPNIKGPPINNGIRSDRLKTSNFRAYSPTSELVPGLSPMSQVSPKTMGPSLDARYDYTTFRKSLAGLEESMEEAIMAAEEASNADKASEIVHIIEEALTSIRKASIPATTNPNDFSHAGPLVISDSDRISSKAQSSSTSKPSPNVRPLCLGATPSANITKAIISSPVEAGLEMSSTKRELAILTRSLTASSQSAHVKTPSFIATQSEAVRKRRKLSSSTSSSTSSRTSSSSLDRSFVVEGDFGSSYENLLAAPEPIKSSTREFINHLKRAPEPDWLIERANYSQPMELHSRRSYKARPRSNPFSSGSKPRKSECPKDNLLDAEPRGLVRQSRVSKKHISHHHYVIARNWSRTRKRTTAAVACANTALVGLVIGIYAGEVPRLKYQLADEGHKVVRGNMLFYFFLAASTFLTWPLPLLHGRKPYTLAALSIAVPLQIPQGLVAGSPRSPRTSTYLVGLLLPRAVLGVALGVANVNSITTLLDLFGASLMSSKPHQDIAFIKDPRRHGGGMGVWLGLWTWCHIASIPLGFLVGAGIINNLNPAWGFYIMVFLMVSASLLNVAAPETRRSNWRKAHSTPEELGGVRRNIIRGEIKLHLSVSSPSWWPEEVVAGVKLELKMLCQRGFIVMATYLAWIYAQVVLVIVLLGALLSREYNWHADKVGLGVFSVSIGALLAIPLSKAGIFSRARSNYTRTDSMTVSARVTWSSHFLRRSAFMVLLPLLGLAYTLSSAGKRVHWIVPIIFAATIGFLSNLAIAECYGIIMETYDTSDIQPGVNSRHRLSSLPEKTRVRRTKYSSFPRVTAGIFASQSLGFLLAGACTAVGGVLTRQVGAQASTGVTAGILLFVTVALILVLLRWKEVQVIPDSAYATWRKSIADLDDNPDAWKDWTPVIIGNPSGKMRRMNMLEMGEWSRWTEIRKLNRLTRNR